MTAGESRVLVVDVARDEIRGPAGRLDAAPVIGRIDRPYLHADRSTSVVADLADRMRSVLPNRPAALSDTVVVAHPSSWGTLRRSVIDESAQRLDRDVRLVPRAAAIARSHLGSVSGRYAVVEVFADRADVHIMHCPNGEWDIVNSRAGESDPSTITALISAAVPDEVEAVLVDATDPEIRRTTVEIVEQATVVGRVIPVDRWLLVRFGADRRTAAPEQESPADRVESRKRRPLAPALAAAGVVAVLVVVGIAVAGHRRGDSEPAAARSGAPAPATEQVAIGRVRLTVPAGWTETREPATGHGSAVWPRTTFADPASDRRLTVMQFAIRAGANQQTVASSLRSRIEQRGGDDVQDFREHLRVGGRDVVGYRELSGSGRPVDWYVMAGDRLQVSVGCQAGSTADIAAECERTIASLVIAPL